MRIALAAAAVLAAATASAAGWRTYANPRFGFSIDVPQDVVAGAPPANGDGRQFTSPDGRGTVAVYGHFFVTTRDLAGDARETAGYETEGGLRITYRVAGATAYTFSGLKGDRIVYVRTVLTCGRDAGATLRAEYPADQKARYDALVSRMAASLHGSSAC